MPHTRTTDIPTALNFLTPEVVLNAAKEIRLGKSVQLDARLDYFDLAYGGREKFQHKIIDFNGENPGNLHFYGHDDVLHFNTQGSSQWDGLRHVGIQESGFYYNGVRHDDIKKGSKLGTQSRWESIIQSRASTNNYSNPEWVERGGIVGRGVLLDYVRWREHMSLPPAPVTEKFGITVKELDQVAMYQGVTFQLGDILIIRSGYLKWYQTATSEQRVGSMRNDQFIGVEPNNETVEWLWNHHFAAVAGDMVGFETVPVNMGQKDKTFLHEWFLCQWGTPIGEMWDLENLAQLCHDNEKWSFFFTSAPLHITGGVGTPPNAIAVL